MGMAVGRLIGRDVDAAAEVVMLVLARTRRQAFEHSLQILVQKGLVLIDDDRSGGVLRLHVDPAMSDARAGDDLIHGVGDVYELQTLTGPQADHAVMRPDRGLTDLFNTCHLVHSLSCVTSGYARLLRSDRNGLSVRARRGSGLPCGSGTSPGRGAPFQSGGIPSSAYARRMIWRTRCNWRLPVCARGR